MSISRAKSLRTSMTDAERRLWYRLRAHRLKGIKFKRQVVIGHYIADFACFERKLIIEVDGGQHEGKVSDIARDRWLTQQGFRVIRFWNNEVLQNTDAVIGRILEVIDDPADPLPARRRAARHPLPQGRGERQPLIAA